MKSPRSVGGVVRYLVELSAEHPTLPRAEVVSSLIADGASARITGFSARHVVVEGDVVSPKTWDRLGLARHVSEVLAEGSLSEVVEAATTIHVGARFRVRENRVLAGTPPREAEQLVGEALRASGTVDLEHPEVEFRVLVAVPCVLGRAVHSVDRRTLEKSRGSRRPFDRPVSLHPKFARALVNLSRVPRGGRLLDPFCGTGGILVEAARIGVHPLGSDLSPDMVEGTRRNLDHFEVDAELRVQDVGDVPSWPGTVDAIATDTPYGRSTSTRGEPVEDLLRRALAAFSEVLEPGRIAAVVVPRRDLVEPTPAGFSLEDVYAVRVHRSLTRHFAVLVRSR